MPPVAQERQQVDLRSFVGGLNTKVSPHDLQPNEVQDCQNVLFDDEIGKVVKRSGFQRISTVGATSIIMNMHTFIEADGTKTILAQRADGTIRKSTDGGLTWANLVTGLTANTVVNFITFENCVWYCNGINDVHLYDGTYDWVLDGSTWTSQEADKAPPGESTGDNSPDVPLGTFLEVWNDRVFLAKTANNASEVYFSRYYDDAGVSIRSYNAKAWPSTNHLFIAENDGQVINGMKVYLGNFCIFKNYSLYVVRRTGFTEIDLTINKVPGIVGALFNRTIQIWEGLLIFLAHDGLYSFNGNIIDKIGRKIESITNEIQQVVVRFLHWEQTTKANWDLGTSTNVMANHPDYLGDILLDIEVTDFPNNSFEDTSYWAWAGRCRRGTREKSGSWATLADSGPDFFESQQTTYAHCKIYNEAGALQETVVLTPTAYDIYEQKTIDLSDYADTNIKLEFSAGCESQYFGSVTSSIYICAGGNLTIWVYKDEDDLEPVPGYHQWSYTIWFDLLEGGYFKHKTSGNWVSPATNLVTISEWATFLSGYTKNSQTLTIQIKTATTEGGLTSADYHTIDHGEIPTEEITGAIVWCQIKVSMSTTDATVTPIFSSSRIQYYRGGATGGNALAWVKDDRYNLFCANKNSTNNDLVIVLDSNGAFTKFSDWEFSAVCEYEQELIGGDSGGDGYVSELYAGTDDDIAGTLTAVDAYFVTKEFTYYFTYIELLRYYFTADRDFITDTLNIDYQINGGSYVTKAVTLSKETTDTYRVNPSLGAFGKFINFRVRNNTLGMGMGSKGLTVILATKGEIQD